LDEVVQFIEVLGLGYIGYRGEVVQFKGENGVQPTFGLQDFHPVTDLSVHIIGEPIGAVGLHPTDVAGRYLEVQLLDGIKMFIGEVIADLPVGVKTAHIDIVRPVQLVEYVLGHPVLPALFKVFVLKFVKADTGMWHDELPHHKDKDGHQGGPDQVGAQKTPIGHPRTENGHNLRVAGQFGCKEDDRKEKEYGQKQVADHQGEIAIKYHDLAKGSLIVDDLSDLFRQVGHDANGDKEHQHPQEGDQITL